MARTPSANITASRPPNPRTAEGHAALAVSHSRAATHHARKAEALSRDAKRAQPKSAR
jgi:hypothetical protein